MSPEEFRQQGHRMVDWMADYLRDIREYPVMTRVEPGDLISQLPVSGPEDGEPMDLILADLQQQILPAVTHWNHPRFHSYFSNSSSGPGMLGEMAIAALNANGMLWKSCPAATELEQVTLDWLRRWLGLPERQFGIIYDCASVATQHAIVAARERADAECRLLGASRGLTMYCSEHAHSSNEKGAISIGVGQGNVRKIGLDAEFRMRADLLREAVARDVAAGLKPFCVVSAIGTTATTAADPTDAIADVAAEYGMWLHVDAAYAGTAAFAQEFRPLFQGWERADSIVVNPHKWMGVPMDLSVLYTKHPETLRRAYSLIPDYLVTAEDSKVVNFMDYGSPLGRRFRALKLWFVMRYYGRLKLAEMIRAHCLWARELAGWAEADGRFEIGAPVPFSLVCLRVKGSDGDNHALMDHVNASGTAFLSPTSLNGKLYLRVAIGDVKTTREDIEATWAAIRQGVAAVSSLATISVHGA
jgi:aromatic-L-amino-acid/L-tryptophan decarboxylase